MTSVRVPSSLVLLTASAIAGPSDSSAAQSLDEAVNEQLDVDFSIECFDLLFERGQLDNPNEVLEGSLQTLCRRGGSVTPPASSASGGGQAVLATAPGIVQKRLRELEPAAKVETDAEGASADAVVGLDRGVSLFVSTSYDMLDREQTGFEAAYESDVVGVTLGGDVRLGRRALAGIAVNYLDQRGDFAGEGSFDATSYGVLGFAAIVPSRRVRVDLTAGYLHSAHDRNRFVEFREGTTSQPVLASGLASADFDSSLAYAGVRAIYRQPVDPLNLLPIVGLDVVRWRQDGYAETGDTGLELRFEDDERTSVLGSLGLGVSTAIEMGPAFLIPEASALWQHEFANDQRELEASFVDDLRRKTFSYRTDEPDRNFALLAIGAVAVLPNGLQPYAQARALVGHRFLDSYGGAIGVRVDF